MTLKISTATISIRYVSFLYLYWKFVFQFSTKVFHIFIFIFIFEGKYWVHSFRREQWLGDWEAGMFRWKDPSSAILMYYNIQWVEIQFRSTNGMLSRCKSDFIQFSLHLFVCLLLTAFFFCLRTVADIVVNNIFNHHIAVSSVLEMEKHARWKRKKENGIK